MAGLREGQDVLVRFGMAVAGPDQINGGALHGPRVLGDKPSCRVHVDTRPLNHGRDTFSRRASVHYLVHNLRAEPTGK